MKNKKGEISWYLLSAILVAIVLVVLFLGSGQAIASWKNKFVDKDNVDLIIVECKTACLSGPREDYCDRLREVYSDDESLAGKRTCEYLEDKLADLSCEIKC